MPESGLDYTDSFDAKYAHNHCHTSMDPAFVRSFACLKVSVDGADLFVLEKWKWEDNRSSKSYHLNRCRIVSPLHHLRQNQ